MTVNAPPPAAPPTDRVLRAILAILFSVSCFSVLNAISKTLTQHYPVAEVVWARYLVAFGFMLVLFLPRSGRNLFRWNNVGSQIIRGLLLFASSFLYFHGLVHMPLATAASISVCSMPIASCHFSARLSVALSGVEGRFQDRDCSAVRAMWCIRNLTSGNLRSMIAWALRAKLIDI